MTLIPKPYTGMTLVVVDLKRQLFFF
ncbi:uncharacterized protein METZ01_LOCUS87969 [marine metagenome]|uniref:Uncharacterized protein n=1 Tax=marine metagenome TaxID=408172 RepID=A0A381V427_9ZZZZ